MRMRRRAAVDAPIKHEHLLLERVPAWRLTCFGCGDGLVTSDMQQGGAWLNQHEHCPDTPPP